MVNAQGPIARAVAARRAARQTGTRRRPIQNLMSRIRARRAGVATPGDSNPGSVVANYPDILADYPNVNPADYPDYAYY